MDGEIVKPKAAKKLRITKPKWVLLGNDTHLQIAHKQTSLTLTHHEAILLACEIARTLLALEQQERK